MYGLYGIYYIVEERGYSRPKLYIHPYVSIRVYSVDLFVWICIDFRETIYAWCSDTKHIYALYYSPSQHIPTLRIL